MLKEQHYFKENQKSWNDRVHIHKSSSFYDVEGFLKGKTTLNELELAEIRDVSGKKVLHLQCHFGLDTLSLARMGAIPTGVDLSDTAIDEAKKLADQAGLKAEFICSNVYDLQNVLDDKFDLIFTSYGVIGWLPDLDKWANIIETYLKPGGSFYMAEFHPFVWMLDDDFKKIHYSYFNNGVIETEMEGTYAEKESELKFKEYSWNHSISEVMNALINHGMKIDFMNEYDYSPYDCFPNMVKNPLGNFYLKGFETILPMVYYVKATKV